MAKISGGQPPPRTAEERSPLQPDIRLHGGIDAWGGLDLHENAGREHRRAGYGRFFVDSKFAWPSSRRGGAAGPGSAGPSAATSSAWDGVLSVEAEALSAAGSGGSYDDGDLDLFEAWLRWRRGSWEVTAGRQLVRWGKTDQISPVDVLNPQDFRLFIVPELEERKTPAWMLRARRFFSTWSVEGVFIPFFEPAEVDYFDSDWAIFRHFREQLLAAPLPPAAHGAIAGIDVVEHEPANTLKNSQYGLRLETTVGDVDLAASYFSGRDRQPFFYRAPFSGLRVSGSFDAADAASLFGGAAFTGDDFHVSYRRDHVVGLEFETTTGLFGLRGEAAWARRRAFLTDALRSRASPVWQGVLGLDYLGVNDWYLNVQVSHQYLDDYSDRILYFRRHNSAVNGELRREFAHGTWIADLRWFLSLTDGGSYWHPRLTRATRMLGDISLGGHVFGGAEDTLMGFYDANDFIYLRWKYSF
ncbi:MAG: hypothetical protein JW781_11280 [Deltaproteobacteria bacterium]|nr:hypothetical protein [Candidatus Anaeroferrophillacea bacterium]